MTTKKDEVTEINPKIVKKAGELEELITVNNAQYPVIYEPAHINFIGKDKLNSDIKKIVSMFENVEVSAQYEREAKKERTHINKMISALKEGNKNINSTVGKEIIAFENDTKIYIKQLENISNVLKLGIDKYENKIKEDKHNRNLEYIGKALDKANLPSSYLQDIEQEKYNPKWDNKSFAFGTFEKEVKAVVQDILKEEKQKQENIQIIIATCEKTVSKLDYRAWVKQLDNYSVAEVISQINNYDKQVQEEVARNQQKKANLAKEESANNEIKNNKVINTETGEVVDEVVNINLSLKLTKKQLKVFTAMLKRFVAENAIDMKNIKLKQGD